VAGARAGLTGAPGRRHRAVAPTDTTAPCEAVCGRKRLCGHPCAARCHGDAPCPPLPCTESTPLTCICGNRIEKTTCGYAGEPRPPKLRTLECNDRCALIQRNHLLAEALEIANPKPATIVYGAPAGGDVAAGRWHRSCAWLLPALVAVYPRLGGPQTEVYEPELLHYARNNLATVKKWERDWEAFVADPTRPVYPLPPMRREVRAIVHMLAAHYRLDTESVDPEPQRSIILKKRVDSRVPPTLLSDASQQAAARGGTAGTPPAGKAAAAAAASAAPAKPAWGGAAGAAVPRAAPKAPVNAIRLRGLDPDTDIASLSSLLAGALQTKLFELARLDRTTVAVLPILGRGMDMADNEAILDEMRELLQRDLGFLFSSADLVWGTWRACPARRARGRRSRSATVLTLLHAASAARMAPLVTAHLEVLEPTLGPPPAQATGMTTVKGKGSAGAATTAPPAGKGKDKDKAPPKKANAFSVLADMDALNLDDDDVPVIELRPESPSDAWDDG